MHDLFSKYPFFKTYLVPLSIGLIGLVLVIIGILTTFAPKKEEISFQNTKQVEAAETTKIPTKQIIIDVEGAVLKPGVYHLQDSARVQDALAASGGLSAEADRSFVEKKLNLAAKLTDGAKLYIPHAGEFSIPNFQFQMSNTDTNSQTSADNSPVNINDASPDQLDALPGIGKTTAQKIINARPYSDIQELLTRKIVSTKVFNEIKDKITVN